MVGRIRSSVQNECGFSLAEVLVAGVILVLAVFPMVGMFDGAFLVSQTAYDINLSSECLQLFVEKVRNIPFYVAHSKIGENDDDLDIPLDVDDYYWGERDPINYNSWTDAPYVLMKAFDAEPYPDLEVHIKMAYVDEEIESVTSLEERADATAMNSNWQPAALYGYDRPKSSGGKNLNLILYEVKVTTSNGSSYTNAQLYASPTDVVANVYIDRVVNVSDAAMQGTRYNALGECYSAPHNKGSITIRAYGEGFSEADVAAGLVDVKLVRIEDADVQLEPIIGSTLTYGEEGGEAYLEGKISLNDGGGDEDPWGPDYRMPGYWHVWLVVEHIISVRNNAFVVEYPAPVYHAAASDFTDSDGDKAGEENVDDETITFTNLDYVVDLEPYTGKDAPGIGALVMLVHTIPEIANDPSGKGLIVGEFPMVTKSGNPSEGYTTGVTLSAHFDFVGKVGGDYKVRVVNCITRASTNIDNIEVMGNTYFELDAGPYYYLKGPPDINEAYIYEDPPVTEENRHFAYDDRNYAYEVEIKGYNFDALIDEDDVKLGLGGDIGVDPPTGDNEIIPESVNVVDTETIHAVFEIGAQVEETERGEYWLYVRNDNEYGTVLNPALEIREPRPIVYSYDYDTMGPWQNYYGVGLSMVGECFDVDTDEGTYVDVMIKEVADPLNDWLATEAMDDPVASADGTTLACELNLVDCEIGDWELYVMSQPAALTDSGYTDVISGITYQSFIDVDYGVPILLTEGVPASGEPWSVSITSRYKDCNDAGVWGNWSAWQTSTEGNGTRAWAWENDPDHETVGWKTEGEMFFAELRGMGFNKDGTIDIACMAKQDLPFFPIFNKTWEDVTVQCDRANALVYVVMDETMKKYSGPDEGGLVDMQIKNNATGVSSDWYINRFNFRSQG